MEKLLRARQLREPILCRWKPFYYLNFSDANEFATPWSQKKGRGRPYLFPPTPVWAIETYRFSVR